MLGLRIGGIGDATAGAARTTDMPNFTRSVRMTLWPEGLDTQLRQAWLRG